MKDTWTHVLQALHPDYDKLAEIMKHGPIIKCELSKKGKYTVLQLVEHYHYDQARLFHLDSKETTEDHVSWAVEQLSEWKDVKRMAWDQWHFKYKKDADKFITLFNLRWAR